MTNEERVKNAEKCCKLVNQRFGLQECIKILMERFNCNDNAVNYVIEMAKNRELQKLASVIAEIGTYGVNKAHYVRISK
jgi:hypothetical protein